MTKKYRVRKAKVHADVWLVERRGFLWVWEPVGQAASEDEADMLMQHWQRHGEAPRRGPDPLHPYGRMDEGGRRISGAAGYDGKAILRGERRPEFVDVDYGGRPLRFERTRNPVPTDIALDRDDPYHPLNPMNPLSPLWIGNQMNVEMRSTVAADADDDDTRRRSSHVEHTYVPMPAQVCEPAPTPSPAHEAPSTSSYDSGSSSYDSGSSSYDSGSCDTGGGYSSND